MKIRQNAKSAITYTGSSLNQFSKQVLLLPGKIYKAHRQFLHSQRKIKLEPSLAYEEIPFSKFLRRSRKFQTNGSPRIQGNPAESVLNT
jgi:hypothetical protein